MLLKSVSAELNRMQQAIRNAFSQIRLIDSMEVSVKHTLGYAEQVTSIDTSLSKLLLDSAREVLPQSFSEEELPQQKCTDPYFWQIDPLDGTDELVRGHLQYCGVSAALLERGETSNYQPVAGLLYLPVQELMIIGDTTITCLTIIEKGKIVDLPRRDRSELRGYVRAIDPNQEVRTYYEAIGSALNVPAHTVDCGGAVHAFVSLILDDINVFCLNYAYSKEWDISGAEPIIKLLGGFLCDLDGAPFAYNRSDFRNRRGVLSSISFSQNELMHPKAAIVEPYTQRPSS